MFCELHGMPTFMTEALCLVRDVQHLNCLILLNEVYIAYLNQVNVGAIEIVL